MIPMPGPGGLPASFAAGGIAFKVLLLSNAGTGAPAEPNAEARVMDLASGFLQSGTWAAFKSSTGWKPFRFRVEEDRAGQQNDNYRADILVLERRLRAGFTFAYAPHGPESFPEGVPAGAFLEALADCLKPFFSRRCVFIRFDLPQEEDRKTFLGGARLSTGSAVQVPDTVLLDIARTEEEILAGMKPKWRYNIKLAGKKGVTVSDEGEDACPTFHSIYRETAERDRIAIHPESYYRALFAAARGSETKMGLWVARHEGEAIAAIVTAFRRDRALYLYGASSGRKRALMPAYALQWEAIRAARLAGCVEYDFFGIPPDDDPSHPMAGLYRFKTGFGGRIAHRAGSVDMAYIPIFHRAFSAAESLRIFWHKRVRKAMLRIVAGLRGRARAPATGHGSGFAEDKTLE